MSVTRLSCPSCDTVLKSANPIPSGKTVKCPKCGVSFRVPGEEPAAEAPERRTPTKPAAPPAKAAREGRPVPPRPQPAAVEPPEPEERPRPRRRPSGEAAAAKTGKTPLFWGLVGGGALVLIAGVVVTILIATGTFSGKPQAAKGPGPVTPSGGGGDPVDPANPDKDGAGTPTGKPLDLAFITADFNAAVIVHPPRLLKSPLLAGLLKQEMIKGLIQAGGIDPGKIEQLVLLIEPFPGGNVAFFPAGIVRFTEPTDGKQLLTPLLGGVSEHTHQGNSYFKGTGPLAMMAGTAICGHMANDRTLVVAPEPTLHKMLTAANAKSPLIERLAKIDLNHDVVGLFVLEEGPTKRAGPTVRQALGEVLKQGKEDLPPQLADATTLADRIRSATLALNLSGESLLKVDVESNNEESATALHNLVKTGLDMLKQLHPEMRKGLAEEVPPDLAPLALSVLDDAVAGIQATRNANRVVVSLKTPRRLAELPDKLLPLAMELAAGPPELKIKARVPLLPTTKSRDEAVAWIKANNKFNPDHKIVADTTKELDSRVNPGQGFLIRLGSGLVKSKKQTYVCGWGDSLFVFELTPEQDKAYPFKEFETTFGPLSVPDDQGRAAPDYILSALQIERADKLPLDQNVAGKVSALKKDEDGSYLSLRLTCVSAGGLSVRLFDHEFVFARTMMGDKIVYSFLCPELVRSAEKHRGPLVVIAEVLAYPTKERQGKPFVVSTPTAALIMVTDPVGTGGTIPPLPPIKPSTPTAPALANLKVKAPSGWKGEFHKFLHVWDYEKWTPGPDGLNESSDLKIKELSDEAPQSLDAYAEKLKVKDFQNFSKVWTEITEKGKLPDGFFLQGVVVDHMEKKSKPTLGLVVVREINGQKVLFVSANLRSEALRKEALEMCRTATIDPAK